MSRFRDDSTALLLIFAAWYFAAYVATGVCPKVFTDGLLGADKISQMQNLYYSTVGGVGICVFLVMLLGWPKRFKSTSSVRVGPFSFPREYLYLAPSGVCTAIIIPTTTMMYTFGVSVMIAMVVMRGCIVVVGRVVDAIQIKQGILRKQVPWEENVAVLFAIAAVATALLKPPKPGEDPFTLLRSVPAMVTLGLYVGAYFARIYIMNWYKNTKAAPDNKAFFGAEQAFAAITLLLATGVLLFSGSTDVRVEEVKQAASTSYILAVFGGVAFGLAAIPSVFLLMFKGRTGTFSTLVNRLTSLIAGTTSTLLLIFLGGKPPVTLDWVAFGLVLVAVGFLAKAERRRVAAQTAVVGTVGVRATSG